MTQDIPDQTIHVIYCPDCREEIGRYANRGDAKTMAIMHRSPDHSPGIISGDFEHNEPKMQPVE